MKLINSIALALYLTSAEAFGPASPVTGSAFGVSQTTSRSGGDMTMRVSMGDRGRRSILHKKLVADSKEAVEQQLLTAETEAVVVKMNWKVRKATVRKIRNLADKYELEMDSKFGLA
jgi:uncharacterized protein (DUF58 family)